MKSRLEQENHLNSLRRTTTKWNSKMGGWEDQKLDCHGLQSFPQKGKTHKALAPWNSVMMVKLRNYLEKKIKGSGGTVNSSQLFECGTGTIKELGYVWTFIIICPVCIHRGLYWRQDCSSLNNIYVFLFLRYFEWLGKKCSLGFYNKWKRKGLFIKVRLARTGGHMGLEVPLPVQDMEGPPTKSINFRSMRSIPQVCLSGCFVPIFILRFMQLFDNNNNNNNNRSLTNKYFVCELCRSNRHWLKYNSYLTKHAKKSREEEIQIWTDLIDLIWGQEVGQMLQCSIVIPQLTMQTSCQKQSSCSNIQLFTD